MDDSDLEKMKQVNYLGFSAPSILELNECDYVKQDTACTACFLQLADFCKHHVDKYSDY